MKVAMFNSFNPSREYALKILKEFKLMKKTNVDLFYTHYDELTFNDKNVKKIWPVKLPFFRQLLNDYFFYPNKISKDYDLYHMTNQGTSMYMKYLDKSKKKIVTIHDLVPFTSMVNKYSFRNIMARKIVRYSKNADRIIAISENTKNDIINYLNINEEKISVVYNGISHDVFYPRNRNNIRRKLDVDDKIVILHVTIDEPRKNIPVILNAFNKLRKDYSNAVLIRIGYNRQSTLDLIKELELEKHVKLYPFVEESVLADWYNAADVFVFPSSYEGFGLPPIEAMASGCPVVSSNATSLGEVLGNAALLVNPTDENDLYSKVRKVLDDDKLRKNMINKGIKNAKRFTWRKCAQGTWAVYKELL